MATITLIDATKPINLAPAILNQNFQNINNELGLISGVLKTANQSLELNHKITAPANGAEAAVFIATALTGNLFQGLVDGLTDVFSVDVDGLLKTVNIQLSASGSSDFGAANFFGAVVAKEKVTFEKDIELVNSGVFIHKYNLVVVLPSNVGNAATAPLNVSDKEEVFIDASNGGSQFVPFGSDALLKLDVTTLKLGQIVTLRLAKKNATNQMKLWNGDNIAPLFAKFDYANGITDIAYTVYPTFDDTLSGNSWITLQYVQVSVGVNRLLVLSSNNVTNV
jgi:hypothetical protein